jgi:CDP-6-deoxy-D-xylo-4-hexulose-3-dehydrase
MPLPRFDWPLATDSFSLLDRARIAWWQLTTPQFTMGPRVEEFEREMSKLAGVRALGVCNGSVANQLVFELWKVKHPDQPRPLVIVPAVTWVSSITPAMMAGFEIAFCDINLTDLSFDYDMLARMLENRSGQPTIIWPTALIGFCPDMERLHQLAAKHGAEVFLDACENTLSYTRWDQSILASAALTTTSCYFSHQITAVELGFVFFRDESDYMLARMFRNHGMSRSLTGPHAAARKLIEDANPSIDPSFLFAVPGTNLRPSDVHAMFGLRDIKRVDRYRLHRTAIYRRFHEGLDQSRYYLPPLTETHVGFCLPIMRRDDAIGFVKQMLNGMGVATRPLIGGNLLHQPPFKRYGRPEDYPNAEWVHQHAGYCGLHPGVTEDMVDGLVEVLNGL